MKVFIKMKKLLFVFVVFALFFVNCTEEPLPLSPYDGVNYGDTTIVIDTLSSASFVNLHKELLSPSCNVLGCHDGSFEPDFRFRGRKQLVVCPKTKFPVTIPFPTEVSPWVNCFSTSKIDLMGSGSHLNLIQIVNVAMTTRACYYKYTLAL